MDNRSKKNALMKKWGEILDAGDAKVTNPKVRYSTAVMLENQAAYLNGGAMLTEFSLGNAGTTWGSGSLDPNVAGYSGDGVFHQIAVPMVRRTFPELIAHEIVGVQPLTGPVGIAFALRYRAGQSYNSQLAGHAEVGYNTVDRTYTGSQATSAAEALGSNKGSGVGSDIGLGIGAGTHQKEVTMTIEKAQVTAQTRKLRSRWSLEVAQDIKAMHGLDLEEEMMDILSYEITAEIDRELVNSIRTVANSAGWDYTSSTDADGRWESEKLRNLYNRLIRDANQIAINTRRGAGNFVICSPGVCASFESIANFSVHPLPNDVNTAVTGVAKIGSLDGRMTVYRDTFASGDDFLVGYKGVSEYDTGVIYLPYIQLMASKATFEDSFQPAIGLMSRYAVHNHIFGASNYYRLVRVHNLLT